MSVLTDSANMPADCKVLSTRFVRTWREKVTVQTNRSGSDVQGS